MAAPSPRSQLTAFIDRFTPDVAATARAALAKVRTLVPGAIELVYDNYNALVVGFGPTERPSEAICSVAIYPTHVSFCFLNGASLPDPDRLLKGGGNVVRHIRLEEAGVLDRPAVRTLIGHAIADADQPFNPRSGGTIVIRSISAKQRPRRPRA
jgi:hypothetical protein